MEAFNAALGISQDAALAMATELIWIANIVIIVWIGLKFIKRLMHAA